MTLLDRLDAVIDPTARSWLLPPDGAADLPDEFTELLPRTLPTGAAIFVGDRVAVIVQPPFAITDRTAAVSGFETAPLRAALLRDRTLAVILARLGGYSMGVLKAGEWTVTKTGGRFVKNRHRKGGQSQRRFERIREGQIREHFDSIHAAIQEKLVPHTHQIEHVVMGGDRRTVESLLARAPLPPALAGKLLPRFIDAPEPRLEVLKQTPRAIWSSRVAIPRQPSEWRQESDAQPTAQ